MKRTIFLFVVALFLFTVNTEAQRKMNNLSSAPGAFSRMGFGARGIGMGNAISAVKSGNIYTYYNPALAVFQNDNAFNAQYTFLGLDRSLNFISFTRRFDFYSDKDTILSERKPRSTAGVSFGLINAGVSNIDQRDNQGFKKGTISTSENMFYLSFANKFSEKISLGVTARFYYYKLYEDVTTTGLGFDLGAIYTITPDLAVSLVLSDINSKYDWDSAPIYGQEGGATTNNFPLFKKLGVSYYLKPYNLQLAGEVAFDNYGSSIFRFGAEYGLYEGLFVRGGIDNIFLNNGDEPIKPSLGFSYSRIVGSLTVGVDYAFQVEQYSTGHRHIIGLNIIF
ncbi:MAG: hypothetical protein LC102_03405 [Ignavibacteriales bacterium]|nr:hypothetical protein [Ignavibacteriaceae bacterium]MCZ2142460.1 hypothetical protein [Ignavibacteriales bacterium]WKZ72873.1 MAG: hypothetical protein QY308_01415 [Ignavibacteriaceae bacterium]